MLSLSKQVAVWEDDFGYLQRQHLTCTSLKDEAESILKEEEGNKKVLDWIRKSDEPETSQRNVWQQTGLDAGGTEAGKWFLETSEFKTWINGIGSNLETCRTFWLRGISKIVLICHRWCTNNSN